MQLEGKAVKFQGESLYLREKIASLWNRLQIPEAARDNFNNLYSGFTSKIIKAVSFLGPSWCYFDWWNAFTAEK